MTGLRLLFAPAWLAPRSARTNPALSALVVVVVATLCAAGILAPALWSANQTAGLRYVLEAQDALIRDPATSQRGMPTSWQKLADVLEAHRDEMPDAVREVTAPARAIVTLDTVTARPVDAGVSAPPSRVTLTLDPLLRERFRLVEGEWPQPAPDDLTTDEPTDLALSTGVAAGMGWGVGEVRGVEYSDGREGLRFTVPLRLSGILEPVDAADPDWRHLATGLEPEVLDDGFSDPIYVGLGFADPDGLRSFSPLSGTASTVAWYPMRVEAIDGGRAGELGSGLRAFAASPATPDLLALDPAYQRPGADQMFFLSSATVVIGDFQQRSAALAALLAVVAGGPIGVALLVLLLAIRLVVVRRTESVALLGARGASRGQVAVVLAVEGALLGTVGAALGCLVSALVVPIAPLVALPVALLGVLITAAGCAAIGTRSHGRSTRADSGSGPWRWVADVVILIVAASLALLALLRDHAPAEPDPVLSALPLALAALGAVIALRVLHLLLDAVIRSTRRRRGLVTALGSMRARRDPALGIVPVLALVVGVAMTVFPAAMSATVTTGIDTASRSIVGADVRATAPHIGATQLERIAGADGVEAIAPLYGAERVTAHFPAGSEDITVFVVDAAELQAVQAGRPAALALPGGLARTGESIPAVASQTVADLASGSPIEIRSLTFDIVGTAPDASPFGSVSRWILVDTTAAADLLPPTVSAHLVFVRTSDAAVAAEVGGGLRAILGPDSDVETPDSAAAERRDDPLVSALDGALLLVIGVDAILLGFAIGLALLLAGTSRHVVLGVLAAHGSPRRTEVALVGWEVGPPLLVALPVGLAVGSLLGPLVLAAVDLTPFTGGSVQPAPNGGGLVPLLLTGALLGVAVLSAAAALGLDRWRRKGSR